MNDKLEKLLELLETDKVTISDMEKFLELFADVIRELRDFYEAKLVEFKNEVDFMPTIEELEARVSKTISNLEKTTSAELKDNFKTLRGLIEGIKIPPDRKKEISDVEKSVAEIPPELESLRKEIEELRKDIKETKKTAKGVTIFGGGGTRSASVGFQDLSAQLDGVTKSFTLSKFKKIIGVWASSSPWILRPTVDYTLSGNTITFTSEINAESTLSSGQSVIVLYGQLFGP